MISAEMRKKYLAALMDLQGTCPEHGHMDADSILCDILSDLGLDDIVEAFGELTKWYA